jgi:hypothetical protein
VKKVWLCLLLFGCDAPHHLAINEACYLFIPDDTITLPEFAYISSHMYGFARGRNVVMTSADLALARMAHVERFMHKVVDEACFL